jgi:dienelactone hydrolase
MSPNQLLPEAIEFARRGWTAAIVMRRGYGDSGGGFAEDRGSCQDPSYLRAAAAAVADLKAAIGALAMRPDIDASRILSVGVSAGGFASVALTADPPPGLVAGVSFAGGRGSDKPDDVCAADKEVAAFAAFGKASRLPMLWVYGQNDHFFGPALAQRFRDAFAGAGGKLTFIKATGAGASGSAPSTLPGAVRSPIARHPQARAASSWSTTPPSREGLRSSATYLVTVMLEDAQFAHRQFVDLERIEARLLDGDAPDREPADRQCPDGDGAERRGAHGQRQQAGGGEGAGSAV